MNTAATRIDSAAKHRRYRLARVAAGLLGLALLLLIHRYAGINHDASIYFGQVLHQLQPGIFDRDLFFAYGSQDSFTLLPWLLAQLARLAPLPLIFQVGAMAGLLAFSAAGWFFLQPLLPTRPRYWAWLAILCLPSAYSVLRVFSYGEPFLTARPLAEALSLFALGWLIRRRLLVATLCLFAAGLLHPLQALGTLLIAWPWLILQDRRWWHLAWLGLPVLALGLTSIRPFDGLYRVLDPTWLKDLSDFTLQLFVTQWYPVDWAMLARDLLLLGYAGWRLRDAFGRWCVAGLAGLLLGIGASLVLADLLHLALPTALQLWRTHWLAHWLANAAIGALLYYDLSSRQWQRASVLALLTTMTASGFLWTWAPVLLLYVAWPCLQAHTTQGFQQALGRLAILFIVGLLAAFVAEEWLPFRLAHYRFDLYAIDRRILAFPLVGFGLALLGLWAWQRSRSAWQHGVLLALAAALVGVGALRWDARSPIARALEAESFNPALFGAPLPRHAQVFWDLPLYPAVWVALQRSDYFSPWQLAGSVFNRGTPQEGRLRLERVRPVIEEDMYCQDRHVPQAVRLRCRISDETLRNACSPGQTRPPDYLVLPYRQAQPALGHWSAIDPVTAQPAVTFWLYACPSLLRALDPPRPTSPDSRQ